MDKKVLILTPSTGFGELIHQALEAHGDFAGSLSANEEQALSAIKSEAPDLFILDAQSPLKKVEDLIDIFRQYRNRGKILLFPPEGNEGLQGELQKKVDKVLSNPFYLPDFFDALEDMFPSDNLAKQEANFRAVENIPKMAGPPEWILDADEAAQYLMRLSLESAAQAALISYKDQVWAYAGELSQGAAERLVSAIGSNWAQNSTTDMARFVHLDETQSDYILFATSLGGHFALALVFDTKIPFSKMRQQAKIWAESLSVKPKIKMSVSNQGHSGKEKRTKIVSDGAHFSAGIHDFDPQLPRFDIFAEHPQEMKANNARMQNYPEKPLFSYVMIPRFPNHQLRGEISKQVSTWLPKLCVAYDWRLEHFEVNANYLQWTIKISAKRSPQSVAKIMARQLSKRIFAEYSKLKKEIPSGRFWVSRALIISADHIEHDVIEEYIHKTRADQGIHF